ncbi:unnamed protein product, partial [marine sediment metagenome]
FQVERYYENLKIGEKTYDLKGQEYLSIFFKKNGVPYYRKKRNIQVLTSVQSDLPNSGLRDLQTVLPNLEFSNPKPVELIIKILSYFSPKEGIILDFMEGSGTTGHAVLELNKRDNGQRKFILLNINERKKEGDKEVSICTDICYPRLERIINGSEKGKGLGGNLKYFKTEFVDAHPTDKNKKKLVDHSTEMLCLKEDCFDEVKTGQFFKIFNNYKGNYLGIVYDDEGIEPLKKEVKKISKEMSVYVFSLDASAREEEFEDVI